MLYRKELSDITVNHSVVDSVSLWASEELLDELELHTGDDVRIKTKFDLPFVGEYFI